MNPIHRAAIINIDQFTFICTENLRYAEFNHGIQGKVIHLFFSVRNNDYRFTIENARKNEPPAELIKQTYLINAPLSREDWCISPHALVKSVTCGWACGFGLMEGEGLRIYKVFFETGQAPVCLTFSARPDNYEEGFSVFEKIVLSFSIVEPDPEKKLID